MGHRFYVLKHDGAWRIKHNDRFSAPFDDPEAAIRKVIVFARWSGEQSQVLVQGRKRGSRFHIEWASGAGTNRPHETGR
ncbi:MAG: hypothetical protein L6R19_00265 [Alphaproteobacteria bacterium]|nr:hypothetical protein [Alphaproteobacteria bacterium]